MKDALLSQPITSSTELKHQIMKLNALREEQEEILKKDLKEIYYSLQISTVIRRTIKDLSTDEEVKSSALQTAIGVGSGFLLDKLLFRKGAGLKSYLINAGLRKLVSYFTSGNRLSGILSKGESFT
jgi:hypothetical protein